MIRPCLVMLVVLALPLGAYGVDGAIHSVHHLLAAAQLHQHDGNDSDDEQGAGAEQDCQVAAAASHAAATAVETAPVITPAPADSQMPLLVTVEAPRPAWTEPDRDRAPPSSHLHLS